MYPYPIFTLVALIWVLIFTSGSHLNRHPTCPDVRPEFLVKSMGVSSVRFPVLHIPQVKKNKIFPHGKKTQAVGETFPWKSCLVNRNHYFFMAFYNLEYSATR